MVPRVGQVAAEGHSDLLHGGFEITSDNCSPCFTDIWLYRTHRGVQNRFRIILRLVVTFGLENIAVKNERCCGSLTCYQDSCMLAV